MGLAARGEERRKAGKLEKYFNPSVAVGLFHG